MARRGSTYLADGRWIGPHGIGRFAKEVLRRLPNVQVIDRGVRLLHPVEPVWLASIIEREKPAAYFSPGFNPPLWSSSPFVFTIHDLIPLRFPKDSLRLKRAYYSDLVRPAARRAHRVVTVSEYSKAEIVSWARVPPSRVEVIPLAAGPTFSPDGPRHEPGYPYLLYVGNRRLHKNLPRLMRAFKASGVADDVRLMLSGEPDRPFTELIANLGLDESVVFGGFIRDDDLPSYYRGAVGCVFPSLSEGFGLPAIEAMACGTPVVASTVTAVPEVVGGGARMVDPLDLDSIAEAISDVVRDSELRARLRADGLARARLFSWDATAARVSEVLASAAAS